MVSLMAAAPKRVPNFADVQIGHLCASEFKRDRLETSVDYMFSLTAKGGPQRVQIGSAVGGTLSQRAVT